VAAGRDGDLRLVPVLSLIRWA